MRIAATTMRPILATCPTGHLARPVHNHRA
jgi:hypothetical protein